MISIIAIILLNIFALLTIVLRPKIFGTKLFKPMIWNFKLSILPIFMLLGNFTIFILIRYISAITEIEIIGYIAIVFAFLGILLWILMLPNSGYLITELNLTHRDEDEVEVPIWYDIISILSFALSGVLNTILNIKLIQGIIYIIILDPDAITLKHTANMYLSAFIIIVLVSVGVYFGRYIRFNSWDVINPKKFIMKLKKHFSQEGKTIEFLYFIVFHSCFFMIIYALI
ncbi:MAG: DUF1361 domain-containing protein [Tissierellia bacterium]|nr:DUF1361 domain-containing protein [Tissierellia bacterium]